MPHSPRTAVAAFARRVAGAAVLQGAGQAVLVVAVLASVGIVGARLLGHTVAPAPWWAVAALPVAAAAWWRWRRDRLPLPLAAQHLDRRLQAGGLLVAHQEGASLDAGWQAVLAQQLERTRAAMPRLCLGDLLLRPAVALAIAALLAWWPTALVPAPASSSFAGLQALERLSGQLGDLLQQGALPPEVARELQDKLQQLQQDVEGGGQPEWRELDELAQRLSREGLLAAAKMAGAAGGEGGFAARLAQQALAKAAESLLRGDLGDRGADGGANGGADAGLPPALAGMLQRALQPGGLLDPQQLLQDPAALRELAQALAAAASQFQQSGAAAGLSPERLAQLQALVGRAGELGQHLVVRQGKPGDGRGNGDGSGDGAGNGAGDGAGRGAGNGTGSGDDGQGGLGRGPGFAALRLTDSAQGGADGAMVLPPGAAIPSEWTPIGERFTAPDTAPVPNGAAGGAGSAGTGGATWHLQLAPRHRAVVQRFFPGGGEPSTGQPR